MRRAFFFIVAIAFATTSFASIPRVSIFDDAPAIDTPSAETRVWTSDVLAPFEPPAETELTRALRQGYGQPSTTNASGLAGFLSVDPSWESAHLGMPQSWNRYSYALNNPVNVTDPTGAVPCDAKLPGGHVPQGDCEQVEAVDPETEEREARMRAMDAALLNGVQHAANFSAGMGDAISLGLTSKVRDLTGDNKVVDKCSGAYFAGEVTGMTTTAATGVGSAARGALAMGGRSGSLGTRLARGGGRFFSDSRQFSTVSRQYWGARGGAGGNHLHHWFSPQRAGGSSAGWNLMEVPGGFNSWMGYSSAGRAVEGAIRVGVPASIGAGAYQGAQWGMENASTPCG